MSPPITVIVAVYNLEFYVDRCLASLERQTLEGIEVLVIDDGSSDESSVVIGEYLARRPDRFRYFRRENGGYGAACNFGLERATGRYVMFVDGDDFLDPDACELMYRKAMATDADMLMGNLRYIFSGRTGRHVPIDIPDEKLLDERERKRLFLSWATPCARLYRGALFQDPALRFLPGIIFADVNFSPKSYLAANRIYYVNRELYNYDQTRPTQSMKQTDARVLNVIPALREMLEFFKQKGAFERFRPELAGYTLRHCLGWVDRVRSLVDYPREKALHELFSVLDGYFGDEWLAGLPSVAGRRRGTLIRASRPLGYAPIAWSWGMREHAMTLDDHLEQTFSLPLRGYQALKRRLKSAVLERMTV